MTNFSAFAIDSRASEAWLLFDTRRKTRTYSGVVTWTREGTLTLHGDVGHMCFPRYGFDTPQAAARWIVQREDNYLLSKSDAETRFDPEASVKAIVREANQAALDSYKEALRARREDDDFDRDDHFWARRKSRHSNDGDAYEVPEGWEIWLALWGQVDGFGEPDVIFNGAGRREIKDALISYCENETDTYHLLGRVGLDCEGLIVSSWSENDRRCIAAFRQWARLIIQQGKEG